MKVAIGFSIAVALMLALVVLADQIVGLSPATPSISGVERRGHVWLVAAAFAAVATIDAAVIWLALRRPSPGETHLLGRANEEPRWR